MALCCRTSWAAVMHYWAIVANSKRCGLYLQWLQKSPEAPISWCQGLAMGGEGLEKDPRVCIREGGVDLAAVVQSFLTW